MASNTKSRQRKVSTPKASADSAEAFTSNGVPVKMSKPSKKANETADNALADATKPEKKSRKRAADFFADGEAEPSTKADAPKGKQSHKKAKPTSALKLSKEDGHPIETAKTTPGGDMVEVEPTTAPKNKQRKLKGLGAGEAVKVVGTVVEGSVEKQPSRKRSNKKTLGESDPIDGPGESVSAESVKAKKASKAPKGKTSKAAAEAEYTETQTQITAGEAPQKQEKVGKDRAKNKANSKDLAASDGEGESSKKTEHSTAGKAKANKGMKIRENHLPPATEDGIEDIPNAMDERPFQCLLDKDSHGATPQETDPDKSDNKQVKKRKANAESSNLVDRLAQTGSAQKKLRKSGEWTAAKRVGKVVKDFASSSIEAAKKSAAGASENVGNFIGSGQKSIAEDITGVANGVVDEGKATRRAKSAKKGEAKAVDDETTANGSVLQQSNPTEENSMLSLNVRNEDQEERDSEADGEVDDQTAALLKGFESSDDDAESGDEGYKKGASMPKLLAKTTKELKKVKTGDEPGVVYIGRIPHGFYEQEMRTYFTQFGEVTKLRLSRNKKTGQSKHFAFIEFASKDVASIVAQTMNNYLMFGHILKCHLIPKEQVHENLWKGANRKFRVVPWSKIEARKLEQPATKEVWGRRIEKEKAKREKKLEKVKSIGYEFDVGSLKGVEEIGVGAIEDTPVQEAIEAVPQEQEKAIKKHKTKKNRALKDVPNKGLGGSDDAELERVGSNEVLEQTTVVETAQSNKGQLVVSEEVITKKVRKGGKRGKGVETVVADTMASEPSIPTVRIVTDEAIENISNAAHSIGTAIGLTSAAEEATEKNVAIENGTAERERKRKAKEDVEVKPAKKGKMDGELQRTAKPVKEKKEKAAKGKTKQPRKDEVEEPAKEVIKETEKAVKDKKGKGSKKDKKFAT